MKKKPPEVDEVQRLLEASAARLMEHCDSVQIFVTKHDGGAETTESYHWGLGNWYARYGMVREWVEKENAKARRGG